MGQTQPIDPEVDRDEVPLPARLRVGKTETGDRFHLVNEGGRSACPNRIAELEATTVEHARGQDGLAACRACFSAAIGTPREDLPDNVLIRLTTASVFHLGAGRGVPDCKYSPRKEKVAFTPVDRLKAERVGLERCFDCFGVDPERLGNICPLCADEIGGLPFHLAHCPESEVDAR